jgi:hypothetical protein
MQCALKDRKEEFDLYKLGKNYNADCIELFGGEPLIHPDKVKKILTTFKTQNIKFFTNGLLMENFLKENSNLLENRKNVTFSISFDRWHNNIDIGDKLFNKYKDKYRIDLFYCLHKDSTTNEIIEYSKKYGDNFSKSITFPFNKDCFDNIKKGEEFKNFLLELKEKGIGNVWVVNGLGRGKSDCYLSQTKNRVIISPTGREIVCYSNDSIKRSDYSYYGDRCNSCHLKRYCRVLCPAMWKLPTYLIDAWCEIYKTYWDVFSEEILNEKKLNLCDCKE